MVAFVLISAALSFVALVFNATALLVFRGGDSFSSLDVPTREAIGMVLIRMHGQANGINQTFWGLWLLPFGWLVVMSRFLPRWLGYWLLLDGIAWSAVGMTWFFSPDLANAMSHDLQPVFLAELVAVFWLLIVGAKEEGVKAAL